MSIVSILNDLFFDYTLRTVALGSAILGIVSGALGCFAVLRKRSLLGDVVSHAALPGIALPFILTRSRTSLVLLAGACIAGCIGMLCSMGIVHFTRIKEDSALGIILSVFFGVGIVLLTFIQTIPDAAQAGLDTYLFGQAATLMQKDVITMGGLGIICLSIMMLFWKEFKMISFDPDFSASLGYPTRLLDVLLTTIIVIAIVIGLQTVGVVLMSAMIVAPAAAARQWTNRLSTMVGVSALFGAIAGVAGAVISSTSSRIPTGPTIVLCMTALVAISIFCAPDRGIIWNLIRNWLNRRRVKIDTVLVDLYTLAFHHDDPKHSHSLSVLRAMTKKGNIKRSLNALQTDGFARQIGADQWSLTEKGYDHAQHLLGIKKENSQ